MARLISVATGLFTSASSWALVDATSLLDAEAGNTALTTSYVASQTFTPGAITIDGVAVKLASRAASPSGTITVALDQGGADVSGTVVTINVSDLPTCTAAQNEGGWVFFKFAAPVTLAAATAYSVKAKTSVAAQANLYRNATAANWSRMLRTTTTQAPAAGDIPHIIGEKTGAGTANAFTITFDNTANITLGTSCDTAAPLLIVTGALTVGNGGTLTGGNAAATNYLLKLAGCFIVYSGGTVNLWRASTLPTDSTGTISFTGVTSGDFGFVCRNSSTVSIGPATDPQGRATRGALLAADAVATATAMTLNGSHAWLNGDPILVSSTASVGVAALVNQNELRTLNANAVGAGISVSAALTYDHLGDATSTYVDPDIAVTYAMPRQAEVHNYSGQITINSTSSTVGWFFFGSNTAVVIIQWALLRYGGSTLVGRRGVEMDTTTGSFTVRDVAFRDSVASAMWIGSANAAWNNVTAVDLVGYNLATGVSQADGIATGLSTATNWTIDNWMLAYCSNQGAATVLLQAIGGSVFKTKPLRIAAHQGYNYPLRVYAAHSTDAAIGSFHVHSGKAFLSIFIDNIYQGLITCDLLYSWRNQSGIQINASAIRIAEVRSFGDLGFCFGTGSSMRVDVDKMLLCADSVQVSAQGFWFDDFAVIARIRNAVISPNSGIFKPLQSAITPMFFGTSTIAASFEKCSIAKGGGNFVVTPSPTSSLAGNSYVEFEGLFGPAGTPSNYALVANGATGKDLTVTRYGEATMRLTQNRASVDMPHAPNGKGMLVHTKRNGGALVGRNGMIELRTSVVGDGAAYNGDAPEVWVRANPALGIAADTQLATMSGSAGVWNSTAFSLPVPTTDGAYEIFIVAGSAASPAGWVNVANLAVQ